MMEPKNHSKWCNSKGLYSPVLSCCIGDIPDSEMVDWLEYQWHAAQRAWLEAEGRTTKLRQAMEQIRDTTIEEQSFEIAEKALKDTARSHEKNDK